MSELVATKSLTIDGARIAYRDAGSGPCVVFLHGLGGNSASWEPQLAALSGRYRTVAWDMPGFGASDLLAARPATTRSFSATLSRLMDALGIVQAHGVGTSYGAVILADLAHTQSHRIKSMTFACGVTGMGHLPEPERERLRRVRRGEIESLGQRRFAETRNATYVGESLDAAMVRRVVDLAGSAQPEGYLQAYGALTDANIFADLPHIGVPALVIAGANDPIAPARDCERVAHALRQAAYHCLPHCGHYVNLEQADVFNRLLIDFLASVQ